MGAGGMAFVRLQSRLHYEPEDLAMNLRREVYDLSTRRYVKAFMKVLPKVDPADVYWRMAFMIGSLLYMLSGLYRLEDQIGRAACRERVCQNGSIPVVAV